MFPEDYPLNPAAFRFLKKCHQSKFNLTSAEAISGPPPSVSAILKEDLDYRQFLGESRGSDEALQGCVDFFARHGLRCQAENVALGNSILSTISATLRLMRVKKVLIPTPTFGYYLRMMQREGIEFEILPTKAEEGFLVNPFELEEAIARSGADALLLCYPNNPTGAVMDEENARAIAEIVRNRSIFVISDEAFLGLHLGEENKHCSIANFAPENTAVFTSAMKAMILPVRFSFCCAPKALAKELATLGGHPSLTNRISSVALRDSEENHQYFAENRQKYQANIRLVEEQMAQLNQRFGEIFGEEKNGDEPYCKLFLRPEAGNVVLLDFSGLRGKIYRGREMASDLNVAEWLLQSADIGTVPGACFLLPPEKMLARISVSYPPQMLEQAFASAIQAAAEISNSPSKSPSAEMAMPASHSSIRSRL